MDGKTRYYKNGNPEAYKDFTETQWKGLCERDKAMWTIYNEEDQAPIPQEVIEFTQKNNLESCNCPKCDALVNKLNDLQEENAALREAMSDDVKKEFNATYKKVEDITDEEAEKELIKTKLKELGVSFRANTGVVKLRIKLEEAENANNTE